MVKFYTPQEDAYLRKTSGEISVRGQALELGRPKDSVRARRKKLGIHAPQASWYAKRQKPTVKLPRPTIEDIEAKAREAGMSYGKYVAQEGL